MRELDPPATLRHQVLADPTGRRRRRVAIAGRVATAALGLWLAVLILGGLGLQPLGGLPIVGDLGARETAPPALPERVKAAVAKHTTVAPARVTPLTSTPVSPRRPGATAPSRAKPRSPGRAKPPTTVRTKTTTGRRAAPSRPTTSRTTSAPGQARTPPGQTKTESAAPGQTRVPPGQTKTEPGPLAGAPGTTPGANGKAHAEGTVTTP